jgi:hypothetical protein
LEKPVSAATTSPELELVLPAGGRRSDDCGNDEQQGSSRQPASPPPSLILPQHPVRIPNMTQGQDSYYILIIVIVRKRENSQIKAGLSRRLLRLPRYIPTRACGPGVRNMLLPGDIMEESDLTSLQAKIYVSIALLFLPAITVPDARLIYRQASTTRPHRPVVLHPPVLLLPVARLLRRLY